jgi:hypothetical protein
MESDLQVPAANPIGALAFGWWKTERNLFIIVVIDRYSISFLKQVFCTFISNCFILKGSSFSQNNQVSVLVVFFARLASLLV